MTHYPDKARQFARTAENAAAYAGEYAECARKSAYLARKAASNPYGDWHTAELYERIAAANDEAGRSYDQVAQLSLELAKHLYSQADEGEGDDDG